MTRMAQAPNPTPGTLQDALNQGHQSLTATEIAAVPTTHGTVNPVVVDCTTLPPGTKCGETGCIGGTKIVFYCDNSGGCTTAVKVPC
jgi:hypothetical protein